VVGPLRGGAGAGCTGDPDQISADAKLVDGLCAPRGQRRGFLRRQVVPGALRIRDYYRIPGDARGRVVSWSVLHPPKMLVRYRARAVGSASRDPAPRVLVEPSVSASWYWGGF
jgi:hypothetical protein